MSGSSKKNNELLHLITTASKGIAAAILFCMLTMPVLTSWMNYYLQDIINTAINASDRLIIIRMLMIGFTVWLLKHFGEYTSDLLKAKLLSRIKEQLRSRMFASILSADSASVRKAADEKEYISSFTNDLYLLEERYYVNLIALPFNITSYLILGYSFFAMNRLIASLVMIYALAAFTLPFLLSGYLNNRSNRYLERIGTLTKKLKSIISSYQVIRNFGAENQMKSYFGKINKETEESRFESEAALLQTNHTSGLIIWFVQFIALGIGLILLSRGEIQVGTVIACRMFARDIAIPIRSMIENITRMKSVSSLKNRLSEELAQSRDKHEQPHSAVSADHYDLCFDHVFFEAAGKTIINDFSFCFETGKKYLIIGPNGAGKSTLFSLAKNYQKPSKGKIFIRGTDLNDLDEHTIHQTISYITEETPFLADSVENNITLFIDYPDHEVLSAMEKAHLNIDPKRMIHEIQDDLSSGEKRKIEIARCMLRKLPVVLFDETLASLDIQTAYEIEKIILEYDGTAVLVSHVFSGELLRKYDSILLLENGRLNGCGTYDELFENNESFRNLCRIRFGYEQADSAAS